MDGCTYYLKPASKAYPLGKPPQDIEQASNKCPGPPRKQLPTTNAPLPPLDNEYRTARVADVLSDFRTLQYYIAAAPVEPQDPSEYYTEGWAALRQCSLDGQHILECAADTSVPNAPGGEEEQTKAELKQVLLDAFARRHEGQKIYLRQAAAQRWIEMRQQVLASGRSSSKIESQLRACDRQLRSEIAAITDDMIYNELQTSDINMGRWTAEDPSLRSVQRWLRARR